MDIIKALKEARDYCKYHTCLKCPISEIQGSPMGYFGKCPIDDYPFPCDYPIEDWVDYHKEGVVE